MSIDSPHSGGEDRWEKIPALINFTEELWRNSVSRMSSTDDDVRTGVRFSVFDSRYDKWERWQVGELVLEDAGRFQENADNKCRAMSEAQVVCSGIVADPDGAPPVYDGGIQLSNGLYFATSGLRAVLDRAYCLAAAVNDSLVSHSRYNTILIRSPDETLVRSLAQEMFMKYIVSDLIEL